MKKLTTQTKLEELRVLKINYELLRQHYIESLEFDIALLQDAEEMDKMRRKVGANFLGWTVAHSQSLRKLEGLLKYLQDNPNTWDFKYYDKVINSIPKNESSKKHTSYLE